MFINQNELSFNKIVPPKEGIWAGTRTKNHPVMGLDTETYKGYAWLITDSTGEWRDIRNIDDALEFMHAGRFRNKHNFFYNMNFDFSSIVKYLPKEDLVTLYKTGKCVYKKYKLSYIPKKIFTIIHSGHTCRFYDVAQFYETSLAVAAKEYLGKKKNEGGIDAMKLNLSLKYWNENKEGIIKYCIMDSMLAQELGDLLQRTYKNAFGYPPQRYLSQANVAKEYFTRNCYIPKTGGIPRTAKFLAFHAYHGGRFELIKKGWFKEVTSLDINSAYPYHIANLTQCDNGEWRSVKEVDYDALHGFYACKVNVPKDILPPFLVNAPNGVKMFPNGSFITHLTLNEIKAYELYCDIEIILGYEFKSGDTFQPFKEAIHNLYALKRVTDKKDFKYRIYKKTANSFYGKFYEKNKMGEVWKAGKLFNPVYASEITANTRIQVYEEALKYGDRVIGFATDAVVVEGSVEMDNHKELGTFDVDKRGEACILQSGVNLIGGELKTRGMEKGTPLMYKGVEYDNIFDYMRKKPGQTVYESDSVKPLTLGAAIVHNKKWDIKDINVWHEFHRSTDINKDVKRMWKDRFENGGEMFTKCIDSKAIPIAYVEKAIAGKRPRKG